MLYQQDILHQLVTLEALEAFLSASTLLYLFSFSYKTHQKQQHKNKHNNQWDSWFVCASYRSNLEIIYEVVEEATLYFPNIEWV